MVKIVGRLALLLTLGACAVAPPPAPAPAAHRLELLDAAFAARIADPARAAELLAEAGPGTVLERVRLEAWLDALERADVGAAAWRRLLEASPPADIAATARLGLATALADESRIDEAAAVLEAAPEPERVAADAALLTLGEGPWRERAAARLAVAAPGRLRRAAPELERSALARLDPEQRLARSAAWRAAGSAERAAAELRRLGWSGEVERRRRLALARAEVESGSPSRALATLRALSSSDPEVELVRAEASRREGWQRVPSPRARSSFADCLRHAHSAEEEAVAGGAILQDAQVLVLECGTEAGRPEQALAAWWRLEASGWESERREWLGRRLGVALALSGADPAVVEQLGGAIPDHARCLRFWTIMASTAPTEALGELTEPTFADLYGLWAREMTGQPPAAVPAAPGAPDVEPSAPPWSVAWLLEHDAVAEAAREWRRIRQARGSTGPEAMAEAELAERRGRRNEVIRILRGAFPSLGSVEMEQAPANALRAYLPMPFVEMVRAAAGESGVDPWLIAGVARQESVFVPTARSPAGAIGVMQLLPGTARGHGAALGFDRRLDLEQPDISLRIGARELRRLLDRFGAVEPALAAYNAGETRVRRWWSEQPDRFLFAEGIPIPETYNYVRRVRYLAEAYRVTYRDQWRTMP